MTTKKKKVVKNPKVARTRNGGTWTEAQFFSMIRSALRNKSRFWVPIKQAKEAARRPYKGPNKLQKWEFQCSECKHWFKDKEVEVDHLVEAGSLTCYEDLPGFVERLFCEDISLYSVKCKSCHQEKTNKERENKKKK